MPTLRYPVLRVCAVSGPTGSLRLRLARPGTMAAASGAMLRRRGDRRTLVNGWALEWGDPQPMCRAHQTRSTWGLGLSGNTSPAGAASAVLVSAEHGRLNRRDWGHQLGRLHVSENLLFRASRTPLHGTALLTGCDTSMRRRAPSRTAISHWKVAANNSRNTICGRDRCRSAHPSSRRGNKQNAVHSVGIRRATTRVPVCRWHTPIASVVRRSSCAALPAVCGATYLAFLRFPFESCAEKLYAIGYVSL